MHANGKSRCFSVVKRLIPLEGTKSLDKGAYLSHMTNIQTFQHSFIVYKCWEKSNNVLRFFP